MGFCMLLQQVVPGKMFPVNMVLNQQFIDFISICVNMDIYQEIFNELLNKGYDLNKIDLSHCFTDTKDIPAKKGEISDMMVTRK